MWVNLVTDGLPAVALSFEPGEPNVMKRQPRPPKESIFAQGIGIHVVWVGLWIGMCALASFMWVLSQHTGDIFHPSDHALLIGRSAAFSTLALSQVCHITAIHSGIASFFAVPLTHNKVLLIAVLLTAVLQMLVIYTPFGNNVMKTTELSLIELVVAWLLAASIIPAVELEKAIWRHRLSAKEEFAMS